ncbi:hypothetical protein SCB49_04235 [unidentified eubacterium SCB49]|nr:hypothetical protein SCB49_04235 [unidentified eubacterium SCB49]
MRLLKAAFAFYINSSIHVAFAVTALVGLTQLYLSLELKWLFYAFVFLGTISAYNFVKYAEIAGLHHRSLAKSLKAIQVLSAVCGVLLVLVTFYMPLAVIIYIAAFGVLTFFYAVPFLTKSNLRSVGGIKVFIVALVWAGVTVIVPVVAANELFSTTVMLLFLQRFLLVVVWILPFEIRDVKYDHLSLGTMPQRIGINKTKIVGFVLLAIALLCELLIDNSQLQKILAGSLMVVLTGLMLLKAQKSQGQFFASFWVESIPIWWWLIAYFFFQFTF